MEVATNFYIILLIVIHMYNVNFSLQFIVKEVFTLSKLSVSEYMQNSYRFIGTLKKSFEK